MLNTKEYFKQIEMDTTQQEPLLTELTPEAAATVEGGILFRVVVDPGSSLNIRSGPSAKSKRIGSLPNGVIFNATNIVSNGFRRLTAQLAKTVTGRAIAWVSNSFIRRV
ncbi:MAG: SH3 domain-containing protein [Nostoc sp.]|uniref:SH3 domain-containing protein n=1 Tax=Nostoc sp. TaxID=1180 RepID=UPI002FFCBBCC